jgi:glycosyltransferase
MRLTSRLSIVTPSLNSARTLRATIESIRPLISAGAEFILVDSGSTDETVELARQAGAIILQCPRGNMYEAINIGMKVASGEWLTYINSDDIVYHDSILECFDQQAKGADLIYGNIDYVDACGRFLFSWRSPKPRHLPWLMMHYCPVPQQGALFRSELYRCLGGFSTEYRYGSDYEFFARCLDIARIVKYDHKSIAAFRLMPSQLTQLHWNDVIPEGQYIRYQIKARRRGLNALFGRPFAAAYRWSNNLDNLFLRWYRAPSGRQARWRLWENASSRSGRLE